MVILGNWLMEFLVPCVNWCWLQFKLVFSAFWDRCKGEARHPGMWMSEDSDIPASSFFFGPVLELNLPCSRECQSTQTSFVFVLKKRKKERLLEHFSWLFPKFAKLIKQIIAIKQIVASVRCGRIPCSRLLNLFPSHNATER